MPEREGMLFNAEPENLLLDAIAKLVDPVTHQYSFPPHAFFEGIKKLHAEGFRGKGEIIGIVDTGIDHTHPLLSGAILHARDFTAEDTPDDLHGHGTLVALITRYVAPEAKIINAKAFGKDGRTRESALSAALQWVGSKSPSVVNLSGGISEQDPAQSFPSWLRVYLSNKPRSNWLVHLLRRHWFYSCPVCRSADQLWRSGTIVCTAVGNDRARISCPGRGRRGYLLVAGAASIASGEPLVVSYSAYWPDLVVPELPLAQGTSFSTPFLSGACAVLSEVIDVKSSTQWKSTLRRADVFFEARHFQDAIATYQRVLGKDTHLAQHASGQKNSSCLYCQMVIYNPRMRLAFSYLQSGQPWIAVKLFEDNVAIAPNFADAHMNYGAALRCANLLPESIETYKRAIALSPNKAEAYDGLGDAYFLLGALSDALEAFERSHQLNPARDYPLEQLNKIAIAIGDSN